MPSPRTDAHLELSCLESNCRPELSRLEDQDLKLTLSASRTAQSILRQLLPCTGGISSLMAPERSSRTYRVKLFPTSCCQTVAHGVWRIPVSSGKIPDFHTGSGVGERPFLRCTLQPGGCSRVSNSAQAGQHILPGPLSCCSHSLRSTAGSCIKEMH